MRLHVAITSMKIKVKNIILLAIVLVSSFLVSESNAQGSQDVKKNLAAFDRRDYHFGMHLGYVTSNFFLERRFDPGFNDSLLSITSFNQPGFIIYTLAELHLTKNLTLRANPGISPRVRIINFNFIDEDGRREIFDKEVRSFYVDFPLGIKYRSDRINNFAVYVAAGGQYSLDVASQKEAESSLGDDSFVKIKSGNYLANVGGGFDFFLPYFKFGIELRYSYGLRNLIIKDDTRFSDPINKLSSRNFTLAFTFEG